MKTRENAVDKQGIASTYSTAIGCCCCVGFFIIISVQCDQMVCAKWSTTTAEKMLCNLARLRQRNCSHFYFIRLQRFRICLAIDSLQNKLNLSYFLMSGLNESLHLVYCMYIFLHHTFASTFGPNFVAETMERRPLKRRGFIPIKKTFI